MATVENVTTWPMQDELTTRIQLAALESAGEAIVIADLDGKITYVNPAFERISL